MAKSLFWLSDEACKGLIPHLPRGKAGQAARRRPHGHLALAAIIIAWT